MSVLRQSGPISKSITKNFVVTPGMTRNRTSSLYVLRVMIARTGADATRLCRRVAASTALSGCRGNNLTSPLRRVGCH